MKLIEKLTYINERGENIEFSVNSQYHVNVAKDVTGLGNIKTIINSIKGIGQDGETGVGKSRIIPRDISIFGNINVRDKQQEKRLVRNMNRIMNPHYNAMLVYEFGTLRRVISCKIDNAPDFKAAEVFETFTLQLTCLNPFWREDHETRSDIAAWVGAFEFPIREDDDKPDGLEIDFYTGWEPGYREPSLIVNAFNRGDVETGIRVDFRALGVLTNPAIHHVLTGEFILINTDMIAGDIITVNTGYGEKAVVRKRNGIITNIFRNLDIDSAYMQLEAGDNLFRYTAATDVENLEVSIYHTNMYLGV